MNCWRRLVLFHELYEISLISGGGANGEGRLYCVNRINGLVIYRMLQEYNQYEDKKVIGDMIYQ